MTDSKRLSAGHFQNQLAETSGQWGLVGAAIFRAVSDLWSGDELLAVDALEFFVSDNCELFIKNLAGVAEVDPDRFFRAAVNWERERGMLTE